MLLPEFYVDDVIKRALSEDINYIDLATDLLIPEDEISTAEFVSKAEGVLAGIDCALRTFTFIDSGVKCEVFIHDGEKVKKAISSPEFRERHVLSLKRSAPLLTFSSICRALLQLQTSWWKPVQAQRLLSLIQERLSRA